MLHFILGIRYTSRYGTFSKLFLKPNKTHFLSNNFFSQVRSQAQAQAENVSLPGLPRTRDLFPHHVVVGCKQSERLGCRRSGCPEGHASRMGHSTWIERLSQLFLEWGLL